MNKNDQVFNEIHTYIRNENNEPIGIIAGIRIDNQVFITAAKARTSKGDKFNKKTARDLVIARAKCAAEGRPVLIPASFAEHIPAFIGRCSKYFQNPNPKFEMCQINEPKIAEFTPTDIPWIW